MHTCILRLSAPELDWSQQPPPLSGLPEDVLGTILHFLYAECLPANLGEQTARDCIAAAASLPGLERLVRMCELYLKNTALKQRRFDIFVLCFSAKYIFVYEMAEKLLSFMEYGGSIDEGFSSESVWSQLNPLFP